METGGAIGIDVGSSKTVMAAVRQRGIDIILSDSSGKSTPSVVAYTDEERMIGDSAMNQIKKNFKNTVQYFSRFMGLNTDCIDQLREEEKYITQNIIPLDNKKIGFEVISKGQKYIFTPEQIYAYYLRRTKRNFEHANIQTKDIVVAVPSYFSNVERQAVLDACDIAHYKCIRLINESTAICLNYGFFRRADLNDKDARIVAFVDLGHSKLTVTIGSFLQGKMKILCHHSDRNIGARNMDLLLCEKLGEEFTKKFGCDPRKQVRSRLRLLDMIEKQRKILSANLEATVHLESLLEDEDLHRNIKRTEFEEMIQPMIQRFTQILEEAIQKSGVQKNQIHSVEMVGEATRIPLIQEMTKAVFCVEQVSRTLNSLECVARGCSLQSAMLSPLFRVSDYEVQEYNAIPVSISYSFAGSVDQNQQPKIITKDLFQVGSAFPSTKSITFDNKKGGMELLIHYSQGVSLLQGIPTQIAQYKIKEHAPKHEKFSFILRVSNNIHQIPCLESVEVTEEWQEDEKIPIKKDYTPPPKMESPKPQEGQANQTDQQPQAQDQQQPPQQDQQVKPEEQKEQIQPPQQEYEIKKKNKKQSTTLNYDIQAHALPPNTKKQFKDLENQMFHDDLSILIVKELRNELESYAYEMRNNLQQYGNYEKYADEQTRAQYLKDIQQTVDWIYGEGQNAAKDLYEKKLSEFKIIGNQIKDRYMFYTEIEIFFTQFQAFSQEVNDKIAQIPHLTDQNRNDIITKYTEMEKYLSQIKQVIETKKTYENPGYQIGEVHKKIDDYKAEVNKILSTPPPPPPKIEQQPQQQQNEQKQENNNKPQEDTEMKNENVDQNQKQQ